MSIDWKRKLTSRKFWATVCNFVGMIILAFGGNQETAVKVTEIIMAGAGVMAYIIAEGLVDAAGAGMPEVQVLHMPEDKDKPPEGEEDADVE